MVPNLLRMFHTVELHSLTLTVVQLKEEPSADDFQRQMFSFGLVPRGTTHTAAASSVVGYIPHLEEYMTSAISREKTVSWGAGGKPFPPALQLDLSAAELKSKHPEILLGMHDDPASGSEEIIGVRVSFTLRCSGTGFGAVY